MLFLARFEIASLEDEMSYSLRPKVIFNLPFEPQVNKEVNS